MSASRDTKVTKNLNQILLNRVYNHKQVEAKYQSIWKAENIYEPNLKLAKSPFYNLMMFPYPSAEGLHVGNMYAFCGSDIYGRFKRMHGYDVFEPIGLDGFGIHSENYALKIGKHPMELSKITEANFYRQLQRIGNGFSWGSKLETYASNYYKWTQWIFIQMFKNGLAYRAKSEVNWCPSCKTVLADEQVVSRRLGNQVIGPLGKSKPNSPITQQPNSLVFVCERCGTEVEKKELSQWFFRITNYAQRLLDNLDKLDWSENVKTAQRNWIGKSQGLEIVFACDIEKDSLVQVFTTRADTIFGVTFMALAPEHPLVIKIINKTKGTLGQEIREYVDYSLKKTQNQKLGEKSKIRNSVKTGIFTGFYATNPISHKKVPIYIADYVLMSYGSGAVMGVPAHDQRDWEFAKKYGIDIVEVVIPEVQANGRLGNLAIGLSEKTHNRLAAQKSSTLEDLSRRAFTEYGVLVNSGKYTGSTSEKAIELITKYIKDNHLGWNMDMWHLRDWIISRQRYWGPPIPMIFCQECARKGKSWFVSREARKTKLQTPKSKIPNEKIGHWTLDIGHSSGWAAGWYPVSEKDLPVELPYIKNFKPTGTGVSPLASDKNFVNVACPECGSTARRETDVSDTFLDSAWYFLRYPTVAQTPNSKLQTPKLGIPWDSEITRQWLPVDMYIGGAEHAVLHLLYSRFLTMVFSDLGLADFEEPFTTFRAHGLLIKEGAKMSKSKGNVVNPDDYIDKYGADTLRCYLMFCGRYQQGGDFRDTGIEGMSRFLKRIWRLVGNWVTGQLGTEPNDLITQAPNSLHMMHITIKKVTEDIESLDYNTALAAIMEWMNFLEKKVNSKTQTPNSKEEIENLLLLLAPFAPYMTEELYQVLLKSKLKTPPSVKTTEGERSSKFKSIHVQPWPKYDPKLATASTITLVVQVNGKVRDRINVNRGIVKDEAERQALASSRVAKYLDGKPKKIVFVPDRLINFVV